MWGQLEHENILSLEGVLHPEDVPEDLPTPDACRGIPWVVSKWQENGDILKYIRNAQCTSLQIIDLVRGTFHTSDSSHIDLFTDYWNR